MEGRNAGEGGTEIDLAVSAGDCVADSKDFASVERTVFVMGERSEVGAVDLSIVTPLSK